MPFYERLVAASESARREFLAIPILQRALQGEIDNKTYVAFLGQAYHHVKHTVPLLMACGAHLPDHLNWLRRAIGKYIDEEMGHEEWILDDIAACGGDAAALSSEPPSPATELMIAYAYDQIQRLNPVGFFGMVFVLEGTSVQLAARAAQAIQNRLDLPRNAFRYRNSHGALEVDHIKFFENLMNRIEDSPEQQTIIHSAQMFYRLYGNIFREISATMQ